MAQHDRRRIRCATESTQRGEPLHGTASRVRRWLLVEQPGSWGRDALNDSHLDATVARTLAAHGRRNRVRVLLIRRPDWQNHTQKSRKVFLARTDPDGGWLAELELDEHELIHLDLATLAEQHAPDALRTSPSSVNLVCTNGRHDPCCADLGRPVVRALVAAGETDIWESSHVGGDRFAANIVCLPSGVYFGRVPPERAARLLADLRRGILDLDLYRGRSCYQPSVQAAEIYVRRELAEPRLDALRVTGVRADGVNEVTTLLQHVSGQQIEATVRRVLGGLEHLTCHDNGTSRPWVYELHSVRRRAASPAAGDPSSS